MTEGKSMNIRIHTGRRRRILRQRILRRLLFFCISSGF